MQNEFKLMAASKPYKTNYQREKAKAGRLHWQPAAKAGIIDVRAALEAAGTLQSDDKHGPSVKVIPKIGAEQNFQKGYKFHQTSKRKSPEGFTLGFQFYSSKSKSRFVVKAFYHAAVRLFMVKFFNKSNKSLNKYAVRTGQGDFRAILNTNFDILTHLSEQYPKASFGFVGERSYFKDKARHQTLLEPMENNQRFRIYRLFLQQPGRYSWLRQFFELTYMEPLSTYLMLNKKEGDGKNNKKSEREILDYFAQTYPEINFTDL